MEGGNNGEEALLRSCYEDSIKLAVEHDCKSIAFPLISAGIFGYPKEKAIKVALEMIEKSLRGTEIEGMLVLFDRESKELADSLFS